MFKPGLLAGAPLLRDPLLAMLDRHSRTVSGGERS